MTKNETIATVTGFVLAFLLVMGIIAGIVLNSYHVGISNQKQNAQCLTHDLTWDGSECVKPSKSDDEDS